MMSLDNTCNYGTGPHEPVGLASSRPNRTRTNRFKAAGESQFQPRSSKENETTLAWSNPDGGKPKDRMRADPEGMKLIDIEGGDALDTLVTNANNQPSTKFQPRPPKDAPQHSRRYTKKKHHHVRPLPCTSTYCTSKKIVDHARGAPECIHHRENFINSLKGLEMEGKLNCFSMEADLLKIERFSVTEDLLKRVLRDIVIADTKAALAALESQ